MTAFVTIEFKSSTCEIFMPFTTRANPYSPTLSQNRFGVATIVNEKHKKVWNVTKSVVTLQCQKSTNRLATDKESEFKNDSINN